MNKSNLLMAAYIGGILFLVYVPIAHMIVFSFNTLPLLYYPFQGWSLQWYSAFVNDPELIGSLENSIIQAAITTVVTVAVSASTALALRRRFPLHDPFFYMILLGMIYPGVTLGLTNLVVDIRVFNIPLSIWTVSSTLSVWTVPFGLLILMMRFDPYLTRYEEAARTHRANEWKVFTNVTFPLIRTELIVVALFAFTMALGEVFRSTFVSPLTNPELPVLLLSTLETKPPTPEYFALGTVISVVSLSAILIGGAILVRRGGFVVKR